MQHKPVKLALAALILSVLLAVVVGLTEAGQEQVLRAIAQMEGLSERHFWPGLMIYVLAFAILITLTLPMATVFTVAGGFLFGAGIGSAAALAGMMLGAILTFTLMRLLGVREHSAFLRQGRASAVFALMDRNAVFYVTLLRIVPVAPCFAVNAGAAITTIDFPRFVIASLIGLTPSALVYAGVGAGLDTLLEARRALSPALLLEPNIGLPMLGIVALITLSWLLRNWLPGLRPST